MRRPAPSAVRNTWRRAALVAGGGLVAAGAFPPIDAGVLFVVGLAPLLWSWRDESPGRAALWGFAWGVTFFGAVMYWIFYFGWFAIAPLVGALAGTVALVGAVVGLLGRAGVDAAWVTAAVWTLMEAIRGRFPLGGLPWADAGVSMVDVTPALRLAHWGGAALVTFVVVLATGLAVRLGDALWHRWGRGAAGRPGRAEERRRLAGTLGGLGAVAAIVGVATVTASVGPATGELRFALLQGNDLNRDLTVVEREQRYIPERHFELAEGLEGDYDLIVFPESSMDRDPRLDPYLEGRIRQVALDRDAAVLTNAGVFEADGRSFNANILYGPDGEVVGTYAKQRLVPFGEYVPFEPLLDWIPALDQVPNRYSPGSGVVVFDVAGTPVGTIICFENAFADVTRDTVRDGAEIVVVTTNNRSYRRSSNPAQHVNLSRLRAVETGRPVLHASISGITAVVDADGSVLAESELFVNSVTDGTVTARGGQTPYVRYGEWIVLVAAATVALATGLALRRRSRAGSAAATPAAPERPAMPVESVTAPASPAARPPHELSHQPSEE